MTLSSTIGILQGRLSPSHDGRFQFFPLNWQVEFSIAARMGFASIEWLVDWPDWKENPLLNPSGEASIRKTVEETGTCVNSICADYFMKHRLDGSEGPESGAMAVRLVDIAARLTRQRLILIPFLEENAYPTEREQSEVAVNLMSAVEKADALGVRIGLETEMPVSELKDFLDRFDSCAIGAYYDIGNCTSYEFDCPSDLRLLGKKVFGVHVKDRKRGSPQSVTLGAGDAKLSECLHALREIGFEGVPIMQAWRGNDFLQDAQEQLGVLKRLMEKKEYESTKSL